MYRVVGAEDGEARAAGDTLRLGGAGCISATANVNPARIRETFEAASTLRASEEPQAEISSVRAIFQAYPLIAAMKQVLAKHHNAPHWALLRPPLEGLAPRASERLLDQLSAARFAIV